MSQENMKMKPLKTISYLALVAAFGLCFQGLLRGISYSAEDLSLLRDASTKESYTALIPAIQSETASNQTLSFVVLGDSRGNREMALRVYSRAAQEKPAFILHTGDIVSHGTEKEYLQYHLPLVHAIAPVRMIPVPGNHEKGPGDDFAGFQALYGAERFAFDAAGSRFVGINDCADDSLTANELEFLKEELSKPGVKNQFVIMHIPAAFAEQVGKGEGENYRGFTRNADAFHELMVKQHVRGVFFGHDHGFAVRTRDGVPYVITGGAGAGIHSNMDWLGKFHHYVVVHTSARGVTMELVRLEGDRWVRSKVQ